MMGAVSWGGQIGGWRDGLVNGWLVIWVDELVLPGQRVDG